MSHAIAIMNAKGGVGKSTTTMMLSESISRTQRNRVIIVDSDPQGSISLMLLGQDRLETHQESLPTIADVLSAPDHETFDMRLSQAIISKVSDVRDLDQLHLLPSNITLAWVDRLRETNQSNVEKNIERLMDRLREEYDYVFVDCPPSVSLLTERWLGLADYFLAPAKPDYLSIVGIALLDKLRIEAVTRGERFARNAGTLITMKRNNNDNDKKWSVKLERERRYRRFKSEIPLSTHISKASEFDPSGRTFAAKYPAPLGGVIDDIASELIERINVKEMV